MWAAIGTLVSNYVDRRGQVSAAKDIARAQLEADMARLRATQAAQPAGVPTWLPIAGIAAAGLVAVVLLVK